jgi:hypothetical protein
MSSETSTDAQVLPKRSGGAPVRREDPGFQPWQLYTLAGLICASVVAFFAGAKPPSVRIALIAIVFAAATMGVAALRTLAPLAGWTGPVAPRSVGGRTRAALEREKTLVLRSIKELEFDRAMGKVSEDDFTEMSGRLRSRAVRIMRELDSSVGYRDEIERELSRRLGAASVPTEQVRSDSVGRADPPMDTRSSAPQDAAAACGACGTRNDADARFCKGCGARLEAA